MSPGSQLADRVAALEAEKDLLASQLKSAPVGKATKATAPAPANTDGSGNSQLQFDLAEALRAKGSLQARAKKAEDELVDLRNKSKSDSRLIKDLAADKTALSTKLKDREHELREKRKLVEVYQLQLVAAWSASH